MDDVQRIDEALLALRRLHSAPPRLADAAPGRRVEMSSVLVVDAVTRAGGELDVGGVAARLQVQRSTASRLVELAERGGWVSRARGGDDARRTLVTTTTQGQALHEVAVRWRASYLAAALDGWSDRDVARFASLLSRFADAVAARPPQAESTPSSESTTSARSSASRSLFPSGPTT